jgi:hypothetical protein
VVTLIYKLLAIGASTLVIPSLQTAPLINVKYY